jgi:RNA polymerase sigma-70 factor (ECF subfamily)
VFAKHCTGIQQVTELLIFVFHKYNTGQSVTIGEINHQPGIEPESNKIFQISNVLDLEQLKLISKGRLE